VIKELEDRIQQLTLEVESISCVKQQLEHSNTQLQMKLDQLHSQLNDSQARFDDDVHLYH